MRLLRREGLEKLSLIKYQNKKLPPYAILSHTWLADSEKVSFKDITEGTAQIKVRDYQKIEFCRKQAAGHGLKYFWVDVLCRTAPQAPPAMVKALRLKLRKLSELPLSILLADLIDLCYAARRVDIDEIKRRLKDTEDDFSRLVYYIGRLGTTRSSADTIIRAMIEVPALRKISNTRCERPAQ
jgi:hypothetical protein